VVCLYPDGGTSDVQRLQMVTESASNLKILGVKGNFDDTQRALKDLLSSDDFLKELSRRNIKLSAANSVNFGRIIFQIIYHVYSYLELVKRSIITIGDKIHTIVPSGNFGNALGAYYAKKAGLPIDKIIIASNVNNILTEWINNGKYDLRDRSLIKTDSPAMDILIGSNVERVLFDKFGAERTKELMSQLKNEGFYALEPDEILSIKEDFLALYSTDEEGRNAIAKYAGRGYLMDPHTAMCIKAYDLIREDGKPAVMYSTAEWTKFSSTVAKALDIDTKSDLEALEAISHKMKLKIPESIQILFEKSIVHTSVVEADKIREEMLSFL
jgi:threonine synthase